MGLNTLITNSKIEQIEREVYLMGKDKNNIHSIYLLNEGEKIYEKYFQSYKAEDLHKVYSVTKSITSILIGILIREGFIDNIELDIKEILGINLSIKICDLLNMKSGLVWNEHESMKKSSGKFKRFVTSDSPLEYISDMEVSKNKVFNYNSLNSHLLSYVIKNITGLKPQDFAKKYLFNKIGIGNFEWDTDSNGVAFGGHGLSLRAKDMAGFGQMILNRGQVNDEKIIDEEYIDLIWESNIYTGIEYKYSHHFWKTNIYDTDLLISIGYGGQKIFIDRSDKLVLAINSMMPRKNQNMVDRIMEIILEK